ncbi:MAG: hypothetical protein H5T61_01010 [Thermoflexales bacterium]|nr:hypothetical protein [Thermoflexales bacterium]
MPTPRTVGELLDTLIAMEKASQDFHLQLHRMFAHHPTAAEVFWAMAADEALHIWMLQQARDSLTPQQAASPPPPEVIQKVAALGAINPEKILNDIQTLENAYQTLHELEAYEFGAVLDFVLSEFFPAEYQRQFLVSQLRDHMGRLERLGPPEWRQEILAIKEV